MQKSPAYAPENLAKIGAELLRNGGNATAAVETICPDPARSKHQANVIAQRIRKTPLIRRILAERDARVLSQAQAAVDKYGITEPRAAEEMARLAFAQMRDVVNLETVTDETTKKRRQVLRVRDFVEISDDAHRAIVEVSQKADGTVTIKLGDKLAALNSLARLKGWIQDKPSGNEQAVALIIQR